MLRAPDCIPSFKLIHSKLYWTISSLITELYMDCSVLPMHNGISLLILAARLHSVARVEVTSWHVQDSDLNNHSYKNSGQ